MTPKQLSNPYSTGSGGAFFESRVQAALASLMLSKGVCPCLPSWPIYKVKLQGKYSGFATDDVIVFAKDEQSNREAKLIAQIKHAPAITKSDLQFTEVIQSAWTDFNNPAVFTYGYDALALITGPLTSSDTYDVRDMLEMARTSQDSTDFFDKIKLANFSSDEKVKKLEVFQHHLRNANNEVMPDEETTWKFLRSFHLLGYDLDIKAGVSLSLLHSLIGVASPDDAEKVWLKILNEVQSWNPRAGVLTLKSLPKELLDHFRVIVPPQLPVVPPTPIRETIAAALIGAWDENSPGDRASIEAFTGMSFVQWQDRIREVWLNWPGLFDQKDGRWRVVDRLAFWNQEAPRVSDTLLDQFKDLAVKVLREDEPALDLDPDERFAASIHGKERMHSGLIRKGVSETLALLGAEGGSLSTCSFGKARGVANITVKEILTAEDWRMWASANDILPLLAEASPDSFLQAVQDAATPGTGVFANVFAQESAGVMGRTYITGILWGLENLAWKSEYLVPVCRILADLTAIDPGGNWSNRPSNSLTTILLPWLPQTSAPTDKRHAGVNVVCKRNEDVGWKLVCSLLPQAHSTSSGTHKPIWQKFITREYKDGVPQSQYWEDILFYSDLALQMAGNDVERLAVLVDDYFSLPVEARRKLREKMSSEGVQSLGEDLRFRLWQALNNLTTNHRKFADSENWKVPEGSLEELDVIADLLRPTAPEVRHKRLFAGNAFDLYEETDNYEEQEAKLAVRREDAVGEIYSAGGKELLTAFIKEVGEPWRVGSALGALGQPEYDQWILPALLKADENSLVQFAGGYVWGRYRAAGWQWVDSLPLSDWSNAELGQFFTFLPFCEETWKRVASSMAADESAYWQKASANPYEATGGLESALEKLVGYDRPDVAIRCMQMMLHKTKTLPSDVAVKALLALSANHRLDAYAIGTVLSYLQKNAPEKEKEIRGIEWKFMVFLGRFNNGQPVFLSRWLAEDPDFFCEVIQTLYRSKKAEEDRPEPSEEAKSKARTAYHLLDEWKLPPGSLSDGTFSAEDLTQWVNAVKAKCIESGHWEVAENQIGQVLRYAPVDEEGLWLDSVCGILDQDGHNRMRSGITMEIRNGRGVYTPDGGKWETAAAEEWEKKADRAENKGFALVAQELRRLATSYRHDAERDAKRGSIELE
ncbi:MAG: hypothetical protein QE267_09910 [Akkermansiaceae bacterium]|nr:hypothetical protein [Akkermansiaceae bacterium]